MLFVQLSLTPNRNSFWRHGVRNHSALYVDSAPGSFRQGPLESSFSWVPTAPASPLDWQVKSRHPSDVSKLMSDTPSSHNTNVSHLRLPLSAGTNTLTAKADKKGFVFWKILRKWSQNGHRMILVSSSYVRCLYDSTSLLRGYEYLWCNTFFRRFHL